MATIAVRMIQRKGVVISSSRVWLLAFVRGRAMRAKKRRDPNEGPSEVRNESDYRAGDPRVLTHQSWQGAGSRAPGEAPQLRDTE
jgi:hypothetical protein